MEALGLDCPDVMPRNSLDTVLIREAKFHKSRIVPLHKTTADQLRVYAGHRELMGYSRETSVYFVSTHGNRLAYATLPPTRDTCKRFLTIEDYHAMLDILHGRDQLIFPMFVLGAFRPGELFALRWCCL